MLPGQGSSHQKPAQSARQVDNGEDAGETVSHPCIRALHVLIDCHIQESSTRHLLVHVRMFIQMCVCVCVRVCVCVCVCIHACVCKLLKSGIGLTKTSGAANHRAREVDILESLQGDPGIIQLIDCFEDNSSVKIVTELCTGGDLQNFTEQVRTRLLGAYCSCSTSHTDVVQSTR